MNNEIIISEEIRNALETNLPLVALESSVFCQGLPLEIALETQNAIECAVRESYAIPATISFLHGKILIGTSASDLHQLLHLRQENRLKKIAEKDIALALAMKESGGTTVSATCALAHRVGIKTFATGGIGGVHRSLDDGIDVSADLKSLSSYPLMVISAGIKCILDVEKTLEILESLSVPVISYRSESFPNFFCTPSDIKSPCNIHELKDIVSIFNYRKKYQQQEALLIAQPIAPHLALEAAWFEDLLSKALKEAKDTAIKSSAVTPFLLKCLAKETHQATVKANCALLKANAELAAALAVLEASYPAR